MSSKQLTLIPVVSFLKAGWLFTAILLFCVSARAEDKVLLPRATLSIQEFNNLRDAEAHEQRTQFATQWLGFLKRKSSLPPANSQPAWAREVTEEYLESTGGLKAKFAKTSRANTFAFTFSAPEDDSPERVASFHRAQQSIFMDTNRMSANEWLINFVHEVAHALDSELMNSLEQYNDKTYIGELAELGKKNIHLSDLNPEQRLRLDRWLTAGLNRGFLAEYRAWFLTAVIYEEGLRDGTFLPVPWLEELKRTRPANVSQETHIYRYLSQSWQDPREGLFAHAFIQQALSHLRAKLYAHPRSIPLGKIGKLISR